MTEVVGRSFRGLDAGKAAGPVRYRYGHGRVLNTPGWAESGGLGCL